MLQIQSSREQEVLPLRVRGEELEGKLDTVRGALSLARGMRERTLSVSKLDLSLASMGSIDRRAESAPGLSREDPPPYNFNRAWDTNQ